MKIKIGIGLIVLLIVVLFVTLINKNNNVTNTITAVVQKGDIANTVSVSGYIEAKKTADLSFPVVGTVTDVFVEEGDEIQQGELLATLGSRKLVALRADALASLQKAQAAYAELLAGPTEEARLVTQTNVISAQEALDEVIKTENKKVANALSALLSNDLQAYAQNPNESATPPTVSGTYTCTQEGSYNLSVYTSGTLSGYSYQLTGLEENTYPV